MSAEPSSICRLEVPLTSSGETIVLAIMPSIPVGGMERSNIEIFRLLEDRGARVSIVVQDGHGNRVQKACKARGLRTIPVSVHCDPRAPRNPLALARYLFNWLNFMRQVGRAYRTVRPQWLYLTNLTFFLYSWPILLMTRCKVIFALPIPPDEPPGRLRRWLIRGLWRWLVTPMCTQVVCNSRFTLRRLRDTGARPRSVQVVYYPLPVRRAAHRPVSALCHDDRLKVTYIGRLTQGKGISEIFEAAVRIVEERPDVDFFFAGDYEWKNPYAMRLVERTRTPKLRDRIHFLGEIENVPELLARSDLHVLFSKEEAFGLVVLEAKNEGIPSVVSPEGALPELVTHLEDGFVCSKATADCLYEGLDYFLSNSGNRKPAGDAARCSMTRFEPGLIADQWTKMLGMS